MKNWRSAPPLEPIKDEVTVYHAMYYGLHDPLRQPVKADFYIVI